MVDSDRSVDQSVPFPPSVDLSHLTSQLQLIVASVLPSSVASSPSTAPPKTPVLLSTMSSDEVTRLLNHPNTSLPDIRLCDTAYASDTKTHWSSEEIYCIMGCRKFRNYKHILDVSWDGAWVNGGEFPMSLGSYATVPKAKRGTSLDRTSYKFLDAVHMDIAFGDCVSVGGYRYALILVDRATHYNWVFGLKTLSSDCILSALRLFRAAAGSLVSDMMCVRVLRNSFWTSAEILSLRGAEISFFPQPLLKLLCKTKQYY